MNPRHPRPPRHPRKLLIPPACHPLINHASPQARGLAACWSVMSSRGAPVIRDRIGGRHMAMTNAPTWTLDPSLGPVIRCDSSTSQYLVADGAPVPWTPLTLACWFKVTGSVQNEALLQIADAAGNNYFQVRLNASTTTILGRCRDATAAPAFHADGSEVVPGRWHHACAVFASATSRTVYLDAANPGSSTVSCSPANMSQCFLGVELDAPAGGGFRFHLNGCIADARIYRRALSHDEIRAMFDVSTRWDLYRPSRRRSARWPVEVIAPPPTPVGAHGIFGSAVVRAVAHASL